MTSRSHVTDKTIRSAITSRVSRFRGTDDAFRLVEELELERGAARIDMAFFGEELLGVEIKSPRDSLNRLPEQARIYSRVFDRVYIVAAEPFISKVLEVVPKWWGVVAVHHSDTRIFFRAVRTSEANPNVDVQALVELLWKNELLELLVHFGEKPVDAKSPREKLRLKILGTTNHDEIKALTLEAFKRRQNWRETKLKPPKGAYSSGPSQR